MCEICGSKAPKLRKVIVEGSIMNVCPDCFETLTKKTHVGTSFIEVGKTMSKKKATKSTFVRKTEVKRPVEDDLSLAESVKLVSNYGELIRSRRRELGWSEETLGEKTGLKASLIKKVESGKIVPSLVDAKKIEDALKIKLLEMNVPDEETTSTRHPVKKSQLSVTLGDILREEVSEHFE